MAHFRGVLPKVPGQILIHAFLPDRALCLMAFLMLHVAFTGFTMSCDSCVRAGPCLVPWPLEPRNCTAIYWRLGTRKRTNADHLYRFFLDILHSPFETSVFFLLLFFSCSLKHSYPLLFFFLFVFSVHFRQNGPYPKGRFGWGQSFFGYW